MGDGQQGRSFLVDRTNSFSRPSTSTQEERQVMSRTAFRETPDLRPETPQESESPKDSEIETQKDLKNEDRKRVSSSDYIVVSDETKPENEQNKIGIF